MRVSNIEDACGTTSEKGKQQQQQQQQQTEEGNFTRVSEVFPHGFQMNYFLLVLCFSQISHTFNHIFQINFSIVSCRRKNRRVVDRD